jgi:hypothetical protein
VEDDHVEGVVAQRQRPSVALHEREVANVRRKLARLREEDRRGVDADDLADPRPGRQRPRHRTGAAADLEHACLGGELDVRQVRLSHRPLLRVGGAELEDVGERPDDVRSGVGDRHVDVRHSPIISGAGRVAIVAIA